MVTIAGYGSYLPLYRITRESICEQHGDPPADGEIAVPGHDEDVLTMAVSASEHALEHADATGEDLDAVFVASTSDPFDERGLAAHVAYALLTPESCRVADFQGSARAAGDAVVAARDRIDAGRAATVLVVASDVLTAAPGTDAERTVGSGAGAVVLTTEDGGVASIVDAADATSGFVGRFKRAGETPHDDSARFHRAHGYVDATATALSALTAGLDSDPDRVAMPAPGEWAGRALRSAEVDADVASTYGEVGYAGAASVLLDAVSCLEAAEPGESVVVSAYGPGGVTAVALDTGADVESTPSMTLGEYVDSKEYVPYGKHRSYRAASRGEA